MRALAHWAVRQQCMGICIAVARASGTRITSSLVVRFVDCTVRKPWVRIPAGPFSVALFAWNSGRRRAEHHAKEGVAQLHLARGGRLLADGERSMLWTSKTRHWWPMAYGAP
eukprot:2073835-Prymnesium_polylepis.1